MRSTDWAIDTQILKMILEKIARTLLEANVSYLSSVVLQQAMQPLEVVLVHDSSFVRVFLCKTRL